MQLVLLTVLLNDNTSGTLNQIWRYYPEHEKNDFVKCLFYLCSLMIQMASLIIILLQTVVKIYAQM